jgi:hypothetical protein
VNVKKKSSFLGETHLVATGLVSVAARHGLDHVPPVPDGRLLDTDLCDVLQIVSTTEQLLRL